MSQDTKELNQALIEAVEKGNLKAVKEALANGADPNARKGKKHVLDLVPHRKFNIEGELIQAGAWEKRLKGGLVRAVDLYPAAVPIMIERGADINLRTPMGTPILVAASKGDTETVGLLLDAGADPDAGGGFSTALTEAIASRNLEMVELLLGYGGAGTEATGDHLDTTPLTLAAGLGMTTVVESLLALGAQVNRACNRVVAGLQAEPLGESGSTALMMAAKHNHPEAVIALLKAGADPHQKDGEGRTALDWAGSAAAEAFQRAGVTRAEATLGDRLLGAAEAGDLDSLREALAGGADPNVRDDRQRHLGWTPLIWAAAKGHVEVAEALIQAGADLEAAEEGNLQALKWLGSETATETLREQMNMTLARRALAIALEFSRPEVALTLIRAGCALDQKGGLGFAPLHLAVAGGHTQVVEALLEAGADPKIQGPDKVRPLDLAAEKGQSEISELLLSRVKMTKKQLDKALLAACETGQVDLVRRYLKMGADPNAKTKDARQALAIAMCACRFVKISPGERPQRSISVSFTDKGCFALLPIPEDDSLALASALLEAGADPESEGVMDTALMAACRFDHARIVAMLLEAGANPSRVYNERTPRETAELFNSEKALAVLKGAGAKKSPPRTPEPSAAEPPSSFKSAKAPKLLRASRGKSFQSALSEIAELCQSTPVSHDDGSFTLHVKTSVGEIDLESLQDDYLARGCFLAYQSTPSKLWAFPLKDPLKALAFLGTAGPNYDIGPGNIIDWFTSLDRPYRITSLDYDLVGGRFLGTVRAPEELANSMYELCPDTVDQGFMSIEDLAESLGKTDAPFTLWWD